jgi:preprotein translocase subunit SecG
MLALDSLLASHGGLWLASIGGFFWGLLAFVLVIVCLLLIAIILIQDPKGGGLASAFGAGPGGESLLGARAQRDVATWTGWLTAAFLFIVIILVVFDPSLGRSIADQNAGPSPDAIGPAPGAKDAEGGGTGNPLDSLQPPPLPPEAPTESKGGGADDEKKG